MNLDQGITMQTVVGETVKPQAFGVDQICDIPIKGLFCGRRGWTRSVFLLENRRFWRGASAPTSCSP